ncbi:MAG TPA: hypothetical protein VJR04_06890 [Terriglobales bacterium]|nr:hypothetical protein [Terriglobales bacterium]
MSKTEAIVDWANLPAGLAATSLWDSIHDGELRGIESDLLARTLTVRFEVPYIRSFHNLPSDLIFSFKLQGVQSVRALRFAIWPGEFSLPPGLPWEEQQRLNSEYRRKWRQETQSWEGFESAVNSDDDAELTDGEVVSGNGTVALRLGVQTSDGEWYEAFVRAETLLIARSDEKEFDLEHLLTLGKAYWEAFANTKAQQS